MSNKQTIIIPSDATPKRIGLDHAPVNPMKFIAISDTHQYHDLMDEIPSGDVLIHCGDFTNLGLNGEVDLFFNYITSKCDGRFKYMIMIVGNHEWLPDIVVRNRFESYFRNKTKQYKTQYFLLLDESIIIHDNDGNPIKVFGTKYKFNVTLPFMKEPIIKSSFGNIPNDIDILLTHFPSNKGGLDIIYNGKSRGSEELTKLLDSNYFTKLRLHCFGHNHDARGYFYEKSSDRLFINAATVIGQKSDKNLGPPFVFYF